MTRREWIACAAAAPLAAAEPDIDKFFDDFLLRWVRNDPEMATNMRLFPAAEQERLDAQLSDVSDERSHQRIAHAREGLAELRRFDRAKLDADRRFSAEMLEYLLNDVVAEEPFLDFRFPLNQMRGVQNHLPTLFSDIHPVRSRRDAENYLARLDLVGSRIDQAAGVMRDRAAKGMLLPRFILVETADQMKRFTTPEPGQNILVTSLAAKLPKVAGIEPAQRAAMLARAERSVRESVYPAYRRAQDQLSTQQVKATDAAGLSRLPRGLDAYAFYLRRYTTTDMTAEQIHRTGLDEVTRIQAEMEAILQKLGYREGPFKDRMKKVEEDNYYPDTPDVRTRVLADYEKFVADARQRSESQFARTPKAPCIVQRIPEFQEANAAANYQAPPPDGSRPGIFRVPMPGPRFTKLQMRSLAYHEAIPGHHFQLALAVEMTNLPRFRRSSPFGSMSAYSEGWGLYAERLAADLGWYEGDPVGNLGRLASELFRARRLVTDTGLHTKQWTRQQAIDYGIRRSEVDRYVVMPGQACSYKIGQLKILELRDRARKQLGARYDPKQFHDVVLRNGSIPLTLLDRTVADWIAQQRI
jgi:uncharacterized protein (DUF885 family)